MARGIQYQIKHLSGRLLGPIGIDRIRLLILKNQIRGDEPAREYPGGNWTEVRKISEIADALLMNAKGELRSFIERESQASDPTTILEETKIDEPVPTPEKPKREKKKPKPRENLEPIEIDSVDPPENLTKQTNATQYFESEKSGSMTFAVGKFLGGIFAIGEKIGLPIEVGDSHVPHALANQKTVVFSGLRKKKKDNSPKGPWGWIRVLLIGACLGYFGYETFLQNTNRFAPQQVLQDAASRIIRPQLPKTLEGSVNPTLSQKLYQEAISRYLLDHTAGYSEASKLLLKAAEADSSNVKAYALLASCYLNLIDSSNKDERTLSVITKLIELSKAKQIDLPEAVIAESEFFLLTRRFEAAKSRIVEYTKSHTNFGQEMFYYISLIFFTEGHDTEAAQYLSQYSDAPFGPRVPYLRALIAEKQGTPEAALPLYRKIVEKFPDHAKSELRIVEILHSLGRIGDSGKEITKIHRNPERLSPKDLARAFYLRARLLELKSEWELAMGDIEKAVLLDRSNQIYLLELYALRARAGEKDPKLQARAKMYWFLSEGEKLAAAGDTEAAFSRFLQARQTDPNSEVPLLRIGDSFLKKNDLQNALLNFRKATELAPKSIDAWAKLIGSLIESYEFEEAAKAMDGLRPVDSAKSMIDRLAGDLYAKQGHPSQAQEFYRKSMARETIDPAVYVAYARSLLLSGSAKEAPFFYAIALRLDPGNSEAIIGTAQAIAASDSIDRGISHLETELGQATAERGKLLSALAALWLQKGEWVKAESTIQLAKANDASLSDPWKVEARLLVAKNPNDKKTLDRAISSYRSAVDRDPHDAATRLELFDLLVRRTLFEAANEELNQIYEVYPKYPGLHQKKGSLYSRMGNRRAAIEEFQEELKFHPTSHDALVGLGRELIEDGKAEEALKQLTLAMKSYPKSAEARQLAGYCNYLLQNYEAAVALFQSAVPLDSGNPLLFKRMGAAYRAMGDRDKASQAFRQYLNLAPDAPDRAEIERFL